METLFRFNIVREANRSRDEIDPIDLAANTQFQLDAAAIPPGLNRRNQLKTLARNFIASAGFVDSVSADRELVALERASEAMDALIDAGKSARADVDTALTTTLGESPSAFIASAALRNRMNDVRDSILAIKLSPPDHNRPLRRLAAILRAYYLIQRFVDDARFPADAGTLLASQHRALRVANAILPTRPPTPARPRPPQVAETLKGLADRHRAFDLAVRELKSVQPSGFFVTELKRSNARLPPEQFRPLQVFAEEWNIRKLSLRAKLLSSIGDITRPGTATRKIDINSLGSVSAALPQLEVDKLTPETPGFDLSRGARIALSGRPDYEPMAKGIAGLRLTAEARQNLSQDTQNAIKELGLDPSAPIAETLRQISAERRRIHERAQELIQPVAQKTFRTIGTTTVAITQSPVPAFYSMSPAIMLGFLPDIFLSDPTTAGVPTTHADIKPAGVMDLLLVKQQLKGYERAEVSHIANMLKGEKTDRIHRKRLETETITFTEMETTVETEQSLETTDRFEMRRESETALEEETGVKGSLMVKGKYGPTVEFKAEGEASWQRKSKEAESTANEVAREVTQKASEKITERVLKRETLRVNRQVEETNQHSFDNALGTGHVSGVYQWVSKVYEAQVFNYGPRTVYDLMIPEPGAFLLEAFRRRRSAAVELEKPPAFEITPDQLTEDNYQTYVTRYQATDVKPPPEPYVTETYDFNTGGEDKDQEFTNSTRIKIPDGYQAIRAHVGAVVAVWDSWTVDVVIGQHVLRFENSVARMLHIDLDHETGSVPFAMVTDRVGDIAIAAEVYCQGTERALDLWRAETHAKLINAYRARLSEYEAKLAELEGEAPAEIESGPTARNRALMIDEVKRACISLLSEQHFEMFDAINTGATGLPQIDFAEAAVEGAYVRFFEHAFEWENLSWASYPYFWGRKSTWLDKVVIEDDDDDFQALLKAGYIRVQIPIRPGFVDAVDHFRLFGEPWLGGSLPTISDDTYLPIAEELAEKLGRPGNELPVGDPWEVRVPTSLVKLRDDDQLPRWQKQADGTWAEA